MPKKKKRQHTQGQLVGGHSVGCTTNTSHPPDTLALLVAAEKRKSKISARTAAINPVVLKKSSRKDYVRAPQNCPQDFV